MRSKGANTYYRGAWWWYFCDGLNVPAEGTGTGDKAFNTMAGGRPGGIVCRDDNGTKLWYHYDRLGNVMCVSDDDGNAEELYTMDAFGNLLEIGDGSDGYDAQAGSTSQPYLLTTKEYDADAGLYHFNARWYDSGIGRWISREPTGADGPNLYHYGFNSAPNGLDRDGRGWDWAKAKDWITMQMELAGAGQRYS